MCIIDGLFSYFSYLQTILDVSITGFFRRFQHYRDQPGFALTDYHPLAANWIVLTVHRGQPVAPGCSLDLIGLFP